MRYVIYKPHIRFAELRREWKLNEKPGVGSEQRDDGEISQRLVVHLIFLLVVIHDNE